MKYKVTMNMPGSKYPTEFFLEASRMEEFYKASNSGSKIVSIDGNFYNTAYFVQAVPAVEDMVLEKSQQTLIEKGIIDSEDEIQKRIRLTKEKYGQETKLLREV